jgi:actin-related protein
MAGESRNEDLGFAEGVGVSQLFWIDRPFFGFEGRWFTAISISACTKSAEPSYETPIVGDIGSKHFTYGLAGDIDEVAPQTEVSWVGVPMVTLPGLGGASHFVGDRAWTMRSTSRLRFPLVKGMVLENRWDDFELLLRHIIRRTPVEDTLTMMLTEAVGTSKQSRERTARLAFEALDVTRLGIASQALLTVFNGGHKDGIVVDIGYDESRIVPVVAGKVVEEAIYRGTIGGSYLDYRMAQLLKDDGFSLTGGVEMIETMEKIKIMTCYVAQDVTKELDIAQANPDAISKAYTLHNGNDVPIVKPRFMCAEALFDSSLTSEQNIGLVQLIANSILKCPSDSQASLADSIFLTGLTTLLPNFADRVKSDLKECIPHKVTVTAPSSNIPPAWIGASKLAYDPVLFPRFSVSKEQYDEFGPQIMHAYSFEIP